MAAAAMAFSLMLLVAQLILHELGHCALLARNHVPIKEYWLGLGPTAFKLGRFRLGLLPIGAAVVPDPVAYASLSAKTRMHVALAGPITSFGAAVVFFAAWLETGPMPGHALFAYLALMNLSLALLNILPIPPLDGFHALMAYRQAHGKPVPPWLENLFKRLGTGIVYGAGFFLLAQESLRALRA